MSKPGQLSVLLAACSDATTGGVTSGAREPDAKRARPSGPSDESSISSSIAAASVMTSVSPTTRQVIASDRAVTETSDLTHPPLPRSPALYATRSAESSSSSTAMASANVSVLLPNVLPALPALPVLPALSALPARRRASSSAAASSGASDEPSTTERLPEPATVAARRVEMGGGAAGGGALCGSTDDGATGGGSTGRGAAGGSAPADDPWGWERPLRRPPPAPLSGAALRPRSVCFRVPTVSDDVARGRAVIASCSATVSRLECRVELDTASRWAACADVAAAADADAFDAGVRMASETETVQWLSADEAIPGLVTVECLVRSAADAGLVYPVRLSIGRSGSLSAVCPCHGCRYRFRIGKHGAAALAVLAAGVESGATTSTLATRKIYIHRANDRRAPSSASGRASASRSSPAGGRGGAAASGSDEGPDEGSVVGGGARALHRITLHSITLLCITLYYTALHCTTLHYDSATSDTPPDTARRARSLPSRHGARSVSPPDTARCRARPPLPARPPSRGCAFTPALSPAARRRLASPHHAPPPPFLAGLRAARACAPTLHRQRRPPLRASATWHPPLAPRPPGASGAQPPPAQMKGQSSLAARDDAATCRTPSRHGTPRTQSPLPARRAVGLPSRHGTLPCTISTPGTLPTPWLRVHARPLPCPPPSPSCLTPTRTPGRAAGGAGADASSVHGGPRAGDPALSSRQRTAVLLEGPKITHPMPPERRTVSTTWARLNSEVVNVRSREPIGGKGDAVENFRRIVAEAIAPCEPVADSGGGGFRPSKERAQHNARAARQQGRPLEVALSLWRLRHGRLRRLRPR